MNRILQYVGLPVRLAVALIALTVYSILLLFVLLLSPSSAEGSSDTYIDAYKFVIYGIAKDKGPPD
jgi:predicted PurR-regulated permease PerM